MVRTKEEVVEDLFAVYNKAIKAVKKDGTRIVDQQGTRQNPDWVAVKDCITLLNRVGGLESVDKKLPALSL